MFLIQPHGTDIRLIPVVHDARLRRAFDFTGVPQYIDNTRRRKQHETDGAEPCARIQGHLPYALRDYHGKRIGDAYRKAANAGDQRQTDGSHRIQPKRETNRDHDRNNDE